MNNSTKKITVHGSNINAYSVALSIEQLKHLDEKKKAIKPKVLKYTTDDAGNTDCFLDIFGDDVKYNTDKNEFYYWTGLAWRCDHEQQILNWIDIAMRARRNFTLKALKKHPDLKNYNKLKSHAQKCCNQRDIMAVYEGIKIHLPCKDSKFDKNPHLLNVLNGTIDLRTGKLSNHNRNNFITMLIPIMYDTDVDSKLFKQFLKDTFGSQDYIKYMQRLSGYWLTGETSEQEAYFAYGFGANGKSTYLSLVRYVMNDYAIVIPANVLTRVDKPGRASPEIAQLPHKRLVCCSELNCTDSLNEGKIKIMSSGETLSTRQLYGKSFTFNPEFKFIIDTNYLPEIKGTDHGIWRRIKILPFPFTVPKSKLNKNLFNDLKFSAKEVLAWMVEGAVDYYKHGLSSIDIVDKATKQYRRSQDTLGSFIDACVKKSEGSEVRARALYKAYVDFCSNNLLKPMSETQFGKDFSARGFEKGKDKISRGLEASRRIC